MTISVQAELEAGWHVYPIDLPLSDEGGSLPTLLGLTELGGLTPADTTIIGPRVVTKASEDGSGKVDRFHEARLVWNRKFKVPDDAVAGAVQLAGKIGWQICTMQKCALPTGFDFSGKVHVADVIAEAVPMAIGKTLTNAASERSLG